MSVLLVIGCDNTPAPPVAAAKPYAGVTITVGCENEVVGRGIAARAKGWAARTGATVSMAADADVRIVPPAELGRWAAAGDALPVPKAIQSSEHPLAYNRFLPVYADRLVGWGPDRRAVALAGDGYVLAYRADRFAERKANSPATWEQVAELAAAFGPGSLPPLPTDPARLLLEFHLLAACYDHKAQIAQGKADTFQIDAGVKSLEFHHDLTTGKPRLNTPGFVAAAGWLQATNRFRMPAGDPVTALASGSAAMAVLSLGELARLPRDGDAVSGKFGLAPLPGVRTPDGGVNFVPYFGAGGWVGIVRKSCPNPDAAFDLLADLAGPTRSIEMLSDPALGFGPCRADHLEQAREGIWLSRYGFDAARTAVLADALRQWTAVALMNPAFAPRSPDQGELMRALEAEVRKAATGQTPPADAMRAANAAWEALDAKRPPGEAAEWRRKSAGLD